MNELNNLNHIEELIKNFECQIQRKTFQTSYQHREDLAQEIRLKIIEKLSTVEFKTPCIWSFIKRV